MSFQNVSWVVAKFTFGHRYLLLEFPSLAESGQPQHVVEIGCGCGSSLLPVLKANAAARVTATDISPTAVKLFCEAAERAGIAPERYTVFPCNAADPDAGQLLSGAVTCTLVIVLWTDICSTQWKVCIICKHIGARPLYGLMSSTMGKCVLHASLAV